jgi:hypothetical protein
MTTTNTNVAQSNEKKQGRSMTTKYALAFLFVLVAAGATVGGYFLIQQQKNKNITTKNNNQIQGEGCQPTIKELHKPVLEITLASSAQSKQLMNDTETKNLEQAILEAYNQASNGCSDEYQRWMYGVNIIDQTLLEHAVMENDVDVDSDSSSSISHTFEEEYNLVLRLETTISCDGCTNDQAFASVYPSSFGKRATNGRQLNDADSPLGADEIFGRIESNFGKTITKMVLTTESDMEYTSYYKEEASTTGWDDVQDASTVSF